ncbi:MAG: hypothetical protein JWN60_900 [Acidobacteria bacterium]|nr:hypothetical protein [Acidobacteriota bacterium]
MLADETENDIKTRLKSFAEWLLIRSSGESFALRSAEIELESVNNKLLFSFLDHKGFQTWRVDGCAFKGTEIVLHLTRNFKKENQKVRLVPRVSSAELNAGLETARLEKANKIAALITEDFPRVKLVRVELNEANGRFAQMIFESLNGKQTAALADVSESLTPENLLSTAILWLSKLENRKKKPVENIWIISEGKTAKSLSKLRSLLRENWKRKITLKEISREGAKARKERKLASEFVLKDSADLSIEDLWRGKAKAIRPNEDLRLSQSAQKLIELAPDKIDAVYTKNGETLRFLGLPFARVRKTAGAEKAWFGVEKNRSILSENNREELLDLVDNLKIYRRFDSPNKRHALFSIAPEAWLESILRRNIKLLDANLVLSPLYHQFRAEKDRIDLLALRKDGRLVIVEIKAAPDREIIFQAADYWRKIELLRRKGILRNARIFGEMEIADKPAIVYLVAPTLSFHKDFSFFSTVISPEIEVHRFNLAENWRENLKVFERKDPAANMESFKR